MAHTETGEQRELILHRSTPVPNEPIILDSPGVVGPEPPARLPSQLPPPGNLKIQLQAVKVIGDGRVGHVCRASVRYQGSSPELREMLLPPLVLKVSRPWKADSLCREAFYYEEMECLQGSVIPRYYGVYEATVPDDCDFLVWTPELKREESKRQKKIKKTGRPYPALPRPNLVRVLLLERVGDLLPLGKYLPSGLRYVHKRPSCYQVLITAAVLSSRLCMQISLVSVSTKMTCVTTIFFVHLLGDLVHFHHFLRLSHNEPIDGELLTLTGLANPTKTV